MATSFPKIDFSPLGELAKVYQEGQVIAARRSLADLYQNGDVDQEAAARHLLAAGDVEGAARIAGMGRSSGGGMLDLAREKFNYERAKDDSDRQNQQRALDEYMRMGGMGPQASSPPASDTAASVRNLNPGAMWPGDSSRAYGATGAQTIAGGNKIATFPDAESGAAAQFNLLSSQGYLGKPLAQVLARWSTGNENAPASAYVSSVSRETGLSPNTPITPELLQSPAGVALARSMARFEAGGQFPLDDAGWGRAQARAFGGAPAQAAPVPATPVNQTAQNALQGPAQAAFGGEPQLTSPVQIAQQGAPQGLVSPPAAAAPAQALPDDINKLRWIMSNKDLPAGIRKEAEVRMRALVDQQYAGQKRETPEESAYRASLAERAKKSVDAETATRDSARAASKQIDRLSMVSALADRLDTGATFPTNIKISALAKGLGLSDEIAARLGLKPDQIADAQTFTSLVNEWAMGKIGPGGVPANNFSEADRNFLVQTVAGMGDDPAAVKLKIEMGKRMARFEVQKQADWVNFSKENPRASYYDFEDRWNRDLASQDRFGDLARQAESMIGKPRSGAAPADVPTVINRKTGERMRWDGQTWVPMQ